jgi:hypothetical protein
MDFQFRAIKIAEYAIFLADLSCGQKWAMKRK